MKKIYYLLLISLWIVSESNSQTVKNISPADVATTSLDLIIKADLVGATDQTHLIYRLQGNFPYLLNGEINFADAHVQIEAADSTQVKPIILQGLGSGGQRIENLFRTTGKAKLTVKGIIFSGQTDQGSLNDRFIRTSGANTIVIDNCVFDNFGQSVFRINGGNETIICHNSQFNRLGQLTNPDNGRFIDNRSTNLKLIEFKNCQVSNVTSRFWRNDGTAKTIEKAIFLNNTFARSGQHAFDLGDILEFKFENNILVDPMYFGRVFTKDSTTARFIFDMKDQSDRKISIKNNNIFFSDSLKNSIPRTRFNNDSIMLPENFVFSPRISKHMTASDIASNFSESLSFDNPPILPLQAIITEITVNNSGNQRPQAGEWNTSNLKEVPIYSGTNLGSQSPVSRYDKFYNFCYDSNSKSSKAGTDKKPVGGSLDACSFPTFLNKLRTFSDIGVVFPNPTSSDIRIMINENFLNNKINIRIFNSMGQNIYDSVIQENGFQDLDLGGYKSGIYHVSLNDGNNHQTIKVMKL